jgi:hypothetical protein
VRLTDLVIVDTDADGMPDWWEDRFGLNKNDTADASHDLDGDGASNLSEFLAGTNPTNAASFFHITGIEPEGAGLRVSWSTVGGKSYRVQTNGELSGSFTDLSGLIAAPGTGEATTNYLDPGAATSGPARYYRIRLEP